MERLLVVLLVCGGCGLAPSMPPFAMTGPWAAPAAGTDVSEPASADAGLERTHDPVTDLTRVAVTTHAGRYFLWMQRPRVTFFYVFHGQAAHEAPDTILLIIRTQDPQVPRDNRLHFACDGAELATAGPPHYWRAGGAQTARRHYLFALPLDTALAFARCAEGRITVGGVSAGFGADQFARLRSLLASATAH